MAGKRRSPVVLPEAPADTLAAIQVLGQECMVYYDPDPWEHRANFGALPSAQVMLGAPRLIQTKFAIGLLRFAYDAAVRAASGKCMTWRNVDKLHLDAFAQVAARLLARRLPWTEPQLIALSALGARAHIDTGSESLPSLRIVTTLKRELFGLDPSPVIRANLEAWCDEMLRVPIGASTKPTYARVRELLGDPGTSFAEAHDRFLNKLSAALDEANEKAMRDVLSDDEDDGDEG